MKFKIIFILFNVVVICSFLVIFFMPLAMLGWEYTQSFWGENWYLPLVFVAIIGVLNAYFIANWKMFTLLEREDWDGLIAYLENKIYQKGRIRKNHIRVLVNAYLVTSQTEGIGRLEKKLKSDKPNMVPSFALLLGIPHLLKNNPQDMAEYYREYLDIKNDDRGWISWNYIFALMLMKNNGEAKGQLGKLSGEVKEPVLSLLTYYLMDAFKDDEELGAILTEGRTRLKKKYTQGMMEKEIDKNRENIQVVILSRLVQEALDWLYAKEVSGTSSIG